MYQKSIYDKCHLVLRRTLNEYINLLASICHIVSSCRAPTKSTYTRRESPQSLTHGRLPLARVNPVAPVTPREGVSCHNMYGGKSSRLIDDLLLNITCVDVYVCICVLVHATLRVTRNNQNN